MLPAFGNDVLNFPVSNWILPHFFKSVIRHAG